MIVAVIRLKQGRAMTVRHLVIVGLSGMLCTMFNPTVHATDDKHAAPVLREVRLGMQDFRDVSVAMALPLRRSSQPLSAPGVL